MKYTKLIFRMVSRVGKKNNIKRQQEYANYINFVGSQLWKLEGSMLLNKKELWTSDDMWNFKTNLFYNDSEQGNLSRVLSLQPLPGLLSLQGKA